MTREDRPQDGTPDPAPMTPEEFQGLGADMAAERAAERAAREVTTPQTPQTPQAGSATGSSSRSAADTARELDQIGRTHNDPAAAGGITPEDATRAAVEMRRGDPMLPPDVSEALIGEPTSLQLQSEPQPLESILDEIEPGPPVIASREARSAALAHLNATAARLDHGAFGGLIGPALGRTLMAIGAGVLLGSAAAFALAPAAEAGPVPRIAAQATSTPTPSPSPTPEPGVTGTATAPTTFIKQSGRCAVASAFSDRLRFDAQNGALTVTQLSNNHVTRGAIRPSGEWETSAAGQTYRGRIEGTVLQGQHTYTEGGCNELYNITGQLSSRLIGTGGAAVLPSIGPIRAVLSPPNTTYSVEVSNPGEMPLTFQWTSTTTCGGFLGSGPRAIWEHPHPPCGEEPVHPGAISVRITGTDQFTCTGTYTGGSATGTGGATTCGGSRPPVVIATVSPAPTGVLVTGVGGGVVTTGGGSGIPGGPGGGIVVGGGLLLGGVLVAIRRRCDCREFEEKLRKMEAQLAGRRAQMDSLPAQIAEARADLDNWEGYWMDCMALEISCEEFLDGVTDVLASWTEHIAQLEVRIREIVDRIALLRSLMGSKLGIAGQHRYDTKPHDGWIQIGPNLWADSPEAASAADTAVILSELLKGGFTGSGWVSAVSMWETALAQTVTQRDNALAKRAEIESRIPEVQAKLELSRTEQESALTKMEGIQQDIASMQKTLELLPGNIAELEQHVRNALLALANCQSKSPPDCPNDAEIDEYDLGAEDYQPQPAPAAPDGPGDLPEGPPSTTNESDGGAPDAPDAPEAPEAPPPGPVPGAPGGGGMPATRARQAQRDANFGRIQQLEERAGARGELTASETAARDRLQQENARPGTSEAQRAANERRISEIEERAAARSQLTPQEETERESLLRQNQELLASETRESRRGAPTGERPEDRSVSPAPTAPSTGDRLATLEREHAGNSQTIREMAERVTNEGRHGFTPTEQRQIETLERRNEEIRSEQRRIERGEPSPSATSAPDVREARALLTSEQRAQIGELARERAEIRERVTEIQGGTATEASAGELRRLEAREQELSTEISDAITRAHEENLVTQAHAQEAAARREGTLTREDVTRVQALEEQREQARTQSADAATLARLDSAIVEAKRHALATAEHLRSTPPPPPPTRPGLRPEDDERLAYSVRRLSSLESRRATLVAQETRTPEEDQELERLTTQYRDQLTEYMDDHAASVQRAQLLTPAPTSPVVTTPREIPPRLADLTASQIERAYAAAPKAVTGRAERARVETRERIETLDRQQREAESRIAVLAGKRTRTAAEDAELSGLRQTVLVDIPHQRNQEMHTLFSRFPELAPPAVGVTFRRRDAAATRRGTVPLSGGGYTPPADPTRPPTPTQRRTAELERALDENFSRIDELMGKPTLTPEEQRDLDLRRRRHDSLRTELEAFRRGAPWTVTPSTPPTDTRSETEKARFAELEREFERNFARVDELMGKSTLTREEQEELSRLRRANDLLRGVIEGARPRGRIPGTRTPEEKAAATAPLRRELARIKERMDGLRARGGASRPDGRASPEMLELFMEGLDILRRILEIEEDFGATTRVRPDGEAARTPSPEPDAATRAELDRLSRELGALQARRADLERSGSLTREQQAELDGLRRRELALQLEMLELRAFGSATRSRTRTRAAAPPVPDAAPRGAGPVPMPNYESGPSDGIGPVPMPNYESGPSDGIGPVPMPNYGTGPRTGPDAVPMPNYERGSTEGTPESAAESERLEREIDELRARRAALTAEQRAERDRLTQRELEARLEILLLREGLRAPGTRTRPRTTNAPAGPSPEAQQDLERTSTRIAELDRQLATVLERLRPLMLRGDLPADEVEDRDRLRAIAERLFREQLSLGTDLRTRHPELTGYIAQLGEVAAGDAALEELRSAHAELLEQIRDHVIEWARREVGVAVPAHPLITFLVEVGDTIGIDAIDRALATIDATTPIDAFGQVVLALGTDLGHERTHTLLQIAIAFTRQRGTDPAWGAAGEVSALGVRLAERLADLALESRAMDDLALALDTLRSLGRANDPRARAIVDAIGAAFPASFDTDVVLEAFAADTRPVAEKARELAARMIMLRSLYDATSDPNVLAAIERLRPLAVSLADPLQLAIARSVRVTSEAGSAEDSAKRLFERIRDGKDIGEPTAAEVRIFDEVLPDWRSLGRESFRRRQSALRLAEPLRLYWHRLAGVTRAAAAATANLERTRLLLAHAHVAEAERADALRTEFETARDRVTRFEASIAGSGATGDRLGHLRAVRARSDAAQALYFAGNSRLVREELDKIRAELHGTDRVVERPGQILTELRREPGLYERIYALDKDGSRTFSSTEADSDPELARLSLLRDRLDYLQQRRLDLSMAAGFTYWQLQEELRSDSRYWQGRMPWKEIWWADTTANRLYEQTHASFMYEAPVLAWRMASERNDPQRFAAFLTDLQRAKLARGEAAMTRDVDTPWYRWGWFSQSDRLFGMAETVDRMYRTDQRLLSALQGMSGGPIETLPDDVRAVLRTHGFIARGPDGTERYAVPGQFSWDPVAVGERTFVRTAWDEIFNAATAAEITASFVVGGWAGQIGRVYGLAEGAYAYSLVLASRAAVEATAFVAMEGFRRGGNPFALALGRGGSTATEWVQTFVTLGVLHKFAPYLEAFERGGMTAVRELWRRGEMSHLPPSATLRDALVGWVRLRSRGAVRVTGEALGVTAIGALFGHGLTPEALAHTMFSIGVMRSAGVIDGHQYGQARREARSLALQATHARRYFETAAREIFERARREGRTELNEHERAQLETLKERARQGTGRLELSRDLRMVERRLSRDTRVAVGETTGGWRQLASDVARQRELFGGRTLVEALRTVDDAAGPRFEDRHWTSFRAMTRFMHEVGSWVGSKQELFAKYPEIAQALFEARRAWSDWIRQQYQATVIGTVNDVRNDCDFNFSLGTGRNFDPVPRLRAAADWTRQMTRRALEESGVPREIAERADHEVLFETNSYTDPAILHLYTRLPEAVRGDVIRELTRSSIGVVRYMFEHRFHLPADLRSLILTQLDIVGQRGMRSTEEIARELGVQEWWTPAGREALFTKQSEAFARYQREPNDPSVVREICEIQMLLNVTAEGAYPVPAAGLVTVSIKEAVLEGQVEMRALKGDMRTLKTELAALETRLAELQRPGATADATEVGTIREAIAARQAALRTLERSYDAKRLETISRLTPEEALQSVLGDFVFFWHMAEQASSRLDPYDVVMRYEVSKYAARLLEVARVFGMDPRAGTPYDFRYTSIAKLLRIATQIYKSKEPWKAFGVDRPFSGQEAMRRYLELLQQATGEIMAFLVSRADQSASAPPAREAEASRPADRDRTIDLEAERTQDLVDEHATTILPPEPARGSGRFAELPPPDPFRTQRLGEWEASPDRGPGSGSPDTQRAMLDLIGVMTAERMLDDARHGEFHEVTNPLRAIDHYRKQWSDAMESIVASLARDGGNYWEHFAADDAAYLQEKLRMWEANGGRLPVLSQLPRLRPFVPPTGTSPGPAARPAEPELAPTIDVPPPAGARDLSAPRDADADLTADVPPSVPAAAAADPYPELGAFGRHLGAPPLRETFVFEPWQVGPTRGEGARTPEAIRADQHSLNLMLAERYLDDAAEGLVPHDVDPRALLQTLYRQYDEAITGLRHLRDLDGPNFWEHFSPQEAAAIQGRLAYWDRTGAPLPRIEEILPIVERAVAEHSARPAPPREVRAGGSRDPGLDAMTPGALPRASDPSRSE